MAAAFVGPGTVTVCTLAGSQYGYSLLWALLFSVAATLVLQEMAARLGWVTQDGLGAAIHHTFPQGWRRLAAISLVLSAIFIGNAAYEAGNIGGAVLGLESILGAFRLWPVALGILAFALLYSGRYNLIERLLIALVLAMSICFLITAIVLRPDPAAIAAGLLPRGLHGAPLFTAIALIGTTVVPYNLFLHAASVREKWGPDSALGDVRRESAVAICLGGLISMAIVIVAAAAFEGTGLEIRSAADMAGQLEPLLGTWARLTMGIGLFAAGISSAVTAPLAAAHAARELFDWPRDYRDVRFRGVWMVVLLTGVLFASLGLTPILLIRFAQAANGMLLPLVAAFLLVAANRDEVMGRWRNRPLHNLLGAAVLLVVLLLSARTFRLLFTSWSG